MCDFSESYMKTGDLKETRYARNECRIVTRFKFPNCQCRGPLHKPSEPTITNQQPTNKKQNEILWIFVPNFRERGASNEVLFQISGDGSILVRFSPDFQG